MSASRILFGGVASWVSRGTTVLLGLMLMPVLFRHLSGNELGVWLLLGQTWAGLAVLDFGFGTILVRRIALTAGRSRTEVSGELNPLVLHEIADLVATGKVVYRWLALAAFVLSFASGFFYLGTLDLAGLSSTTIWTAWGILCLSQALGIWASVWTCLLQGLGYVGWDALASSVVNSLTLLAQIGLVLLGGNLVGLAAIAAAGALAQRAMIIRLVQTRRSELLSRTGVWRADLLHAMISPAFRAWLTALGYLLVANTDQFFIAAYRGASAIPAYRAAFLLVLNLHLLAGVFCAPSQVFVSRFWQAGDLDQIHRILRRNARIGLLSMCCGAGVILALGPALFELWLGRGNFVGY